MIDSKKVKTALEYCHKQTQKKKRKGKTVGY